MKMFVASMVLAVVAAQKGGKVKVPKPAATPEEVATPEAPPKFEEMTESQQKNAIMIAQLGSAVGNLRADTEGGGASLVDLVLQAIENKGNVSCTSPEWETCAKGYVSKDCVFGKEVIKFGGLNCIPFLDACQLENLNYCQQSVAASDKCDSQTPCDCAEEFGCGWSPGHNMCLVDRPEVTCLDCATMTKCGKVDCSAAKKPCDCVALGGTCGWSTTIWGCVPGKDTDCNECPEQFECGGEGVERAGSENCPAEPPAMLSDCEEYMQCDYDVFCCERCAGSKQLCGPATIAECDEKSWTLRTKDVGECPDCQGYYYGDYSYDKIADELEAKTITPSQPTAFNTDTTSSSATLKWTHPNENWIAGTDFYSIAYEKVPGGELQVVEDFTTKPTMILSKLEADSAYKVSILPVIASTQSVGGPLVGEFTTSPEEKKAAGKNAGKKGGKAGKKAGKGGKKAGKGGKAGGKKGL